MYECTECYYTSAYNDSRCPMCGGRLVRQLDDFMDQNPEQHDTGVYDEEEMQRFYTLTPATRRRLKERAKREGKGLGRVIAEWAEKGGKDD